MTTRARGGGVSGCLAQHIARLADSAQIIRRTVILSEADIRQAVAEWIHRNAGGATKFDPNDIVFLDDDDDLPINTVIRAKVDLCHERTDQ